jgi:hypothetical protein
MGRVPAAIRPEPDPEGQDVEDDREPEQAVRAVDPDAVGGLFDGERCRCPRQMNTLEIEPTQRRTSIGHALRYPKITRTVPGGAMAARLTVPKMVAASWGNPRVKTG